MARLIISLALIFSATFAHAAAPKLALNHSGPDAAVTLSGDSGNEYLLEIASGSVDSWDILGSFVIGDHPLIWRHRDVGSGARFFRARSVDPLEDRFPRNFRLIDQNGVMHELFYYHDLATLKAIVITFSDGDYSFATKIQRLASDTRFKDGVFFWTIDTNPSKTRAQISQDASTAGVTWPVMHDPLRLTTRDYKARFNGEAFVIRMHDLTIAYRGIIDDGVGTSEPANTRVADILESIIASAPVTITRLEPEPPQPRLVQTDRPIADYATVIAPLLQDKCVTCHSPGNIGPFALTSYQSVLDNADRMREEVTTGSMPPWHADAEYGKFKNDLSLTPGERAQLVDWLAAGGPRNGSVDPLANFPPAPSKWPIGLGPPDQIVTIPLQQIQATGTIPYRYIVARATNAVNHWLRAAIVRPSNRRVVHHYNVWEGRTATPLVVAAYSPGRTESAYPADAGWLLTANMEMTFNLHYTATGEPEVDQPELAVWYAPTPPPKRLRGVSAQNSSFQIPPGARDYEVLARHTFSNPVRLYMVNPHMHVRGSRMRFELTVPGQPMRILASIPKYDFHWQHVYHFDPPLDLPANAVIDVIGAFDNSHLNHENPDPHATVGWGDQSWDEMFIGYMEYSDL